MLQFTGTPTGDPEKEIFTDVLNYVLGHKKFTFKFTVDGTGVEIHHPDSTFENDIDGVAERWIVHRLKKPIKPQEFTYTLGDRTVKTKAPLWRVEWKLNSDPTQATQVSYITRSEYQVMLDRCEPFTFIKAERVPES